jgi:hypothetical protein
LTTRDVGDISTNPGGKSGADWTSDTRDSVVALWALELGNLVGVAGTNSVTATALVSTGLLALSDGMKAVLVPAATNTGAVTLNVGSLGAKAVTDADGDALEAGALVAGTSYLLIFLADSDQWRVIGSAGTTNVTIEGGIILQRRSPSRLAASQGPTTSLTSVASRAFSCTQSTSRVIVEGCVSRITDSGSEDDDGLTIHLYVDGASVESITDAVSPGQHTATPVAFEYLPGDTDSHTYEIRVQAAIATTYVKSSCYLVASEMAPNA